MPDRGQLPRHCLLLKFSVRRIVILLLGFVSTICQLRSALAGHEMVSARQTVSCVEAVGVCSKRILQRSCYACAQF